MHRQYAQYIIVPILLATKPEGESRDPIDCDLVRLGWVREPDASEEELRVTLDWDSDNETENAACST